MAYAERTAVPVAQSIADIRKLVEKAGAGQFQYGEMEDRLVVGFTGSNRRVRFTVRFGPRPTSPRDLSRWEQLKRSQTRALLLVIKAKFESVAAALESFEEAFLAEVMMPDGGTVAQHVGQALIAAYASGQTPPALLPDFSGGR